MTRLRSRSGRAWAGGALSVALRLGAPGQAARSRLVGGPGRQGVAGSGMARLNRRHARGVAEAADDRAMALASGPAARARSAWLAVGWRARGVAARASGALSVGGALMVGLDLAVGRAFAIRGSGQRRSLGRAPCYLCSGTASGRERLVSTGYSPSWPIRMEDNR